MTSQSFPNDGLFESGSRPSTASRPASSPSANLSGLVHNVYRTTGTVPNALVGSTTTILGDKLYVFGGRLLSRARPELTADLYELDLITRHWTQLQTSGDIPRPRYFHSVCALGDTKLVCYGGMSYRVRKDDADGKEQSDVVVLSDVHILDVRTGVWKAIQTANNPPGRYAHCATILPSSTTFTSSTAPLSAIHNNPSGSNPNSGSIGVDIDGQGGAEMLVIGGQDSSNHYIQKISIFNLRSMKWTTTNRLERSCGVYRSVAAPLTSMKASDIGAMAADGALAPKRDPLEEGQEGPSTLVYSNYNFQDVRLNLQVRLPDGSLEEKPMQAQPSPPGLRFPSGGIINDHFVVSGTYLTASRQEYALWALDLRTLTWGKIEPGGSIFNNGSWNRGVLWNRRSTFVVLGNRKRDLLEDYNHRRINLSNVCFIELEAFGLYENPRQSAPTSNYRSVSTPWVPLPYQPRLKVFGLGGRSITDSARELGRMVMSMREATDMELIAIGGERIPVNSRILAQRWGPYFIKLLKEATAVVLNGNTQPAGRPVGSGHSRSRNSSITVTPANGTQALSGGLPDSPLLGKANGAVKDMQNFAPGSIYEPPSVDNLPPASRPRALYLPHTKLTIELVVHYLYTSTMPPIGSSLCTPQILCSVLQLARPYRIDGLLEATVERLHQVLDGRNAAAVFNAAAMAAGGGRSTGFLPDEGDLEDNAVTLTEPPEDSSPRPPSDADVAAVTNGDTTHSNTTTAAVATAASNNATASDMSSLHLNIDIPLSAVNPGPRLFSADSPPSSPYPPDRIGEFSPGSPPDHFPPFDDVLASDPAAQSHSPTGHQFCMAPPQSGSPPIWTGGFSAVVGLQKRGLRGLMEGRRLRERGVSTNSGGSGERIGFAGGSGTGGGVAGFGAGAGTGPMHAAAYAATRASQGLLALHLRAAAARDNGNGNGMASEVAN